MSLQFRLGVLYRLTEAEIIPFEPDKIMLDWEEDEIIGSIPLCSFALGFLFSLSRRTRVTVAKDVGTGQIFSLAK